MNKLDVMDEVSAVQICASSFSQDDIAASKELLYRLLNRSDQMVSRRRDGTQKSLQDIITLLKETDSDDVPTFVARDVNKLLPVTFDYVDVTALLKDIVLLKKNLGDLSSRFDELPPLPPPNHHRLENSGVCRRSRHRTSSKLMSAPSTDIVRHVIAAASPPWTTTSPCAPPYRTTPVYVSRLHYTVTADDVIEHIRQRTKFRLRVLPLESRHNAYFNAFVVRAPTHMLPTIMKEDFWPEGVVFKRFRGKIPTPQIKGTMNSVNEY